ncbi:hypothetical protein [Massilia soli]|uniref:Uncharacterized protein n=1 Tax=Massilia soli TaxID=2792854 RepID=A0ABS7SJ78_9BURK|nr:hypothetical protein [Massilia soli]MBZ2206082.1 hypothetical protein [Massilia soli]
MLMHNWSAKGFQLLSIAPQESVSAPDTSTFRKSAHAGTVWDEARQTMWVFGAETHVTNMDNAVYGWRARDGKFVKHYDADPVAGYRMDGNGVYWSSALKNRPWAMHTYRRMRMVPGTDEFEVMYDADDHALMAPKTFENPSQTAANRVPPVWYYNVVTGTWRAATIGDSAKMVGSPYYAFPLAFNPTYGWISGDGSYMARLSPGGSYTLTNVSGKSNGQQHSFMFMNGDVAYRVGGAGETTLYSRHPLANVGQSSKHLKADFPALAGFDIKNMASVMMPNGKIVIFPVSGTDMHAMILDPEANTVTTTGHVVTGLDKPTLYDLAAEWSQAHGAVILLSRRFTGSNVYGYRP